MSKTLEEAAREIAINRINKWGGVPLELPKGAYRTEEEQAKAEKERVEYYQKLAEQSQLLLGGEAKTSPRYTAEWRGIDLKSVSDTDLKALMLLVQVVLSVRAYDRGDNGNAHQTL